MRTWYCWIFGFFAFLWVLIRTGTNPKRLTYPCQQAAFPLAASWLLAVIAFFGGSLLLKKIAKLSSMAILIVGAFWFIVVSPKLPRAEVNSIEPLPVWEVDDPISTVFVMDKIPPTTGSLAAGDSTVPDKNLSDAAFDTLLTMMEKKDIHLYQTATQPSGIVGADNIVIIKGNFQWTGKNTTSTDRIKGLIWKILQHPDGFSGEILVCDNTQSDGTGINQDDNNSEDTTQSIIDVVNTFHAKGYPVYCMDWNDIWSVVASEYSDGDYKDGYIYEASSKISYPKFLSPSGNYYISLRHGIWDSATAANDSSRLCIIDFPVLKAHIMAGASITVKNWIGVLTTAYAEERYGDWDAMHYQYFFGSYALVARVMAVTYPRLVILDAAWVSTYRPHIPPYVKTDMLLASTDPVAVSWYAAKYILRPIAVDPYNTNPDRVGSKYHNNLNGWTKYLQTAGFPCTKDSSQISVYYCNGSTSIEDNKKAQIIENFKLYQNCPNPFNASTKITFELPKTSEVELMVLDLLGRRFC
jgi:hypothetical protein